MRNRRAWIRETGRRANQHGLFVRWYDLWVGAYYDRIDRVLYVCPIPMLGVRIRLRAASSHSQTEAGA